MGIKGSFTFIKLPLAKQICLAKRYSDYNCHNAAAIMLNRTRGKKTKKTPKQNKKTICFPQVCLCLL